MDSTSIITVKVSPSSSSSSSMEDTPTSIKRPLIINDSTSTQDFEYTLKMNSRSHKQLLLEGGNTRVSLRATTISENKTAISYAVGILDEENGEIELMPATLFYQKRIISKMEKEENIPTPTAGGTSASPNSLESGEYIKSRLLLGESFGTRKTKAMLHSMERNKIDMNQLNAQNTFITSKLDKAISKIQEKELIDKEVAQQQAAAKNDSSIIEGSGLIPDHCPSAIMPHLIYPISFLVPEVIIECCRLSDAPALRDAMLITSISIEDWKEFEEKYSIPIIISSSLPSSAFPEDSSETEEKWSLIIFTLALFKFRLLSEGKLNSITSPIPFINDSSFSSLLKLYAEEVNSNSGNKRWKVSSLSKDKLLSHLCVCFLHLKGQRVDAAHLSATLSLPMSKMCEYFKAVGCKLERPLDGEPKKHLVGKREIAIKMAVLRAPLHIAPVSSGGGASGSKRK